MMRASLKSHKSLNQSGDHDTKYIICFVERMEQFQVLLNPMQFVKSTLNLISSMYTIAFIRDCADADQPVIIDSRY